MKKRFNVICLISLAFLACKEHTKGARFSTDPDSFYFRIDSTEPDNRHFSGRIVVYSDEIWGGNVLTDYVILDGVSFILEKRVLYRIFPEKKFVNNKSKMLDFNMKTGDSLLLNECLYHKEAFAGCNSTLILHNKVAFKNDTIYYFEIQKNLRSDSAELFSRFIVVSEHAGVYSEILAINAPKTEEIRFFRSAGMFDLNAFLRYRKYSWVKYRI